MTDPRPQVAARIAAHLPARTERRPFVLGIAGAQGSGKSTAAAWLGAHFGCPVLSLDDLYLDRAERALLAAEIHPLLATRGVPGTHDWRRGLAVIESLAEDGDTLLPRFDKARDAQGAPEVWHGPTDMLILEGWCLGARPQAEEELAAPVNALERNDDPDGRWRRWVNAQLADYQPLFDRIDRLVLLAAPGFHVVERWRIEQEQALRHAHGADAGMDDAALARFVQHFQRITEHLLRHGRDWADQVIPLDADRRIQPAG